MPTKVFPARLAFLLDHPLRRLLTPLGKRLQDLSIEPGMRVLEIGTGTGFLIPALLERLGPEGHLEAIDVQPALLELARQKVPADAPVTLRVADAADTGLPDASVDAVLLHHVFHELADRSGTIRELRRVLKTGGVLGLWEPRFLVDEWRVRGFEGMFLGARFELEARFTTALGYGRRFRAVEEPPGCRLRHRS